MMKGNSISTDYIREGEGIAGGGGRESRVQMTTCRFFSYRPSAEIMGKWIHQGLSIDSVKIRTIEEAAYIF